MQINLLSLLPIAILFFTCSCRQPTVELKEVKHLSSYPSGSALVYLNNKIYLIGDDAASMLILDDQLHVIDSVKIVPGDEIRIAKDKKPDLESMAIIRYKKQPYILMVGSGSVEPYREGCWLVRPGSKTTDTSFNLHRFYKRVIYSGAKELNIEGITTIPGGIVLANRGNKHFAKNMLVFTDNNFFVNQDSVKIKLIKIGVNSDTSAFNGISGLDYAARSDKLLLTVSTENTYNNYADGSIGKSYLWIVNDISTRKRFTHLNPDVIIDLQKIDERFAGHKIESVCVIKETRTELELLLAADDDKADTWLFRLVVKK